MSEAMIKCPLDKSHEIRKSRMQFHLVSCKKNHDMSKKAICPAHPLHIVDKADFARHLLECPEYAGAMTGGVQFPHVQMKKEPPVGTISLEDVIKLQNAVQSSSEDWDAYPQQEVNDLYLATENREVVRPLIVASKSEKKAWKLRERQRIAQLDYNSIADVKKQRILKKQEIKLPNTTTHHSTSGSSRENQNIVSTSEKKTMKSVVDTNQMTRNLKSMAISNGKLIDSLVVDNNNFPALGKPKKY